MEGCITQFYVFFFIQALNFVQDPCLLLDNISVYPLQLLIQPLALVRGLHLTATELGWAWPGNCTASPCLLLPCPACLSLPHKLPCVRRLQLLESTAINYRSCPLPLCLKAALTASTSVQGNDSFCCLGRKGEQSSFFLSQCISLYCCDSNLTALQGN